MQETRGKISLGTSGWSYREWIGPFYTKEDKSMLRAYTKVFSTVEIDSTFYRYPEKGTVMGWTKYSPEGFIYAAKLPKLITHEKKLDLSAGIEQDVQRFVELMEPLYLSGKLACILIQLPPKFAYKLKEMEDFFNVLPTQVKFAVEFRHLSWMRSETMRLLEVYGVAYTVVDEPLLPPEVHVTSDIAYVRWHGHGARPWYDYRYPASDLETWVPKLEQMTGSAQRVYGYFNNHYHGYAVENCLQVIEMLGGLNPQQTEAKVRVEQYRRQMRETSESTLETFVEPKTTSFDRLLRYFIDAPRLKRAGDIPDNELMITGQTEDRVEATVREYHVVIDLKDKTILHDCADWEKMSQNKKLCKHVGKLLLTIERPKAARILEAIYSRIQEWQFRKYTGQ